MAAVTPRPFVWWGYLLASDEQTGDPEQLEAVCSYGGREEKTVQSIHGQTQRLEREAELAVNLQKPAEQLTAGLGSHLAGSERGSVLKHPAKPVRRGKEENS